MTFADGFPIPEQVCIGLNLLCYRCNLFGHVSKYCQEQSEVGGRCSERGHLSKVRSKPERCAYCGGSHSSKFGACPVRLKILENWRRSTLPADKPGEDAVPIVANAPGLNAHDDFRAGRSYAGVVRNGVRVPQQGQRAAPAPSVSARPSDASLGNERVLAFNSDVLTSKISDNVLNALLAKLPDLIGAIVSDVLAKTLPQFIESVISSVRKAMPRATTTPSSPVFDIGAILQQASATYAVPQTPLRGTTPPKSDNDR